MFFCVTYRAENRLVIGGRVCANAQGFGHRSCCLDAESGLKT